MLNIDFAFWFFIPHADIQFPTSPLIINGTVREKLLHTFQIKLHYGNSTPSIMVLSKDYLSKLAAS
jgi:hypothetical protein